MKLTTHSCNIPCHSLKIEGHLEKYFPHPKKGTFYNFLLLETNKGINKTI